MAFEIKGPLGKKDFLVRTHRPRCFSNNHEVIDVMAITKLLTPENKVLNVAFSGAYCKTCDKYFILKHEYELFGKYGKFLCKTAEELYVCGEYICDLRDILVNDVSILKYVGYTVDQRSGLFSEDRLQILISLIENGILTKFEILTYLNQFIEQHYYQENFDMAVAKWQLDYDCLMKYVPKNSPNVTVDTISYGRRKLYTLWPYNISML